MFAFIGCDWQASPTVGFTKSDQEVFFERFMQIEGKKFAGQQVFIHESMESWQGLDLVMHVREFHPDVVYIPFHVGENTSRTWALYRDNNNRLRFRHDHRHPDGTPESLTLYGGYHNHDGNSLMQVFPADDYTCNIHPGLCDNEWTLRFNENMTVFSYLLRKDGELVFQADFDLAATLN